MNKFFTLLIKTLLILGAGIALYPIVLKFIQYLINKNIIPFSTETISIFLVLGALYLVIRGLLRMLNRLTTTSYTPVPASNMMARSSQPAAATAMIIDPTATLYQIQKQVREWSTQNGVGDEVTTEELAYYAFRENIPSAELPNFLQQQMNQRLPRNEQATLIHELAHAVVAYTLGIYFRGITVRSSGEGTVWAHDSLTEFATQEKGENLICVFLAGAIAENKFAGTQFTSGAYSDYSKVESFISILKHVHHDPRTHDAIIQDSSQAVHRILEENSELLQFLAQRFSHKSYITTSEFCTAVEGFKQPNA